MSADKDLLPSSLLSSIFKNPILTPELEKELFTRWFENGDEAAKDEIIMAHVRLAVSIAPKYKKYGLPVSDLIQEGVAGLLEAFKRFDSTKDVRFSTYAGYWIAATIQHYILTHSAIVRVVTTNDRKRLFFNLRNIKAKMGIVPGARLNDEEAQEVCEKLNVSRKDVDIIDGRMSVRDNSLNDLIGGEDGSTSELQDVMIDENAANPEMEAIRSADMDNVKMLINDALDSLDEREAHIIRARRLQEEPESLETLGQQFNVTPERIRQLEKHALTKLKSFMSRLISPDDIIPNL